jgi:hypothetical protein
MNKRSPATRESVRYRPSPARSAGDGVNQCPIAHRDAGLITIALPAVIVPAELPGVPATAATVVPGVIAAKNPLNVGVPPAPR